MADTLMDSTNSGGSCEIPEVDWSALDGSYDEVVSRLGNDVMWIRFFAVRPCCPAPGEGTARKYIGELKRRIDMREDFDDEQKATLIGIADERLAWYIKRFVKNAPGAQTREAIV